MELYEGMVIKLFPDTDRDAYVKLVRDSGYKCYLKGYSLRIGRKIHEPVDQEARARKLRQARKLNGLTRAQVAEIIHVSKDTVYSWEIGRTYPNAKNILLLKELYRVDL